MRFQKALYGILLTGVICGVWQIKPVFAVETNAQDNTAPTSLIATDLKPFDLRIFGDKNNPKTIYVFSSMSCSHCAVFHQQVWPELLKNFVATNQAKLIYVDMPYDSRAMTGAIYARCIPPQNYEAFMEKMFTHQKELAYAEKPRKIIAEFAGVNAENEQTIEACVSNEALRKQIMQQRNNLSELYVVRATPTIVVLNQQVPERIVGTDTAIILRDVQKKLEGK